MAEKQETVTDLIAWLRSPTEGENAYLTMWRDEIANRLEAAYKRERGNSAAQREAIDYLCERMADMDATFDPSEVECLRAALSAPPRNCDTRKEVKMSRSNYDKPFYVDVGTSVVAVRCASNHDVILEYDHSRHPFAIELAKTACDRMNKEAEISRPRRNCDVGTAEEQDERFHRFCVKHHTGSCAGCHNPVGDYTVANGVRECALVWAQMPYEEGGAR